MHAMQSALEQFIHTPHNLVFPIDLWNIVLYWSLQLCDLFNVCWLTKTHAYLLITIVGYNTYPLELISSVAFV
jgi:hypothetical protein